MRNHLIFIRVLVVVLLVGVSVSIAAADFATEIGCWTTCDSEISLVGTQEVTLNMNNGMYSQTQSIHRNEIVPLEVSI